MGPLNPNQIRATTATINLRVSPPTSWTFYADDGFPEPAPVAPPVARDNPVDAAAEPITEVPKVTTKAPKPLAPIQSQKTDSMQAKSQITADVQKYIERVLVEEKIPKEWLKGQIKFDGRDDTILGGMMGTKACDKDEDGAKLTVAKTGPDYIVNKDGNVIIKCNRDTLKIARNGDVAVNYPIVVTLKEAISGTKWDEMAQKLQSKMEQQRFIFDEDITVDPESK